jgi:hypothetical protein
MIGVTRLFGHASPAQPHDAAGEGANLRTAALAKRLRASQSFREKSRQCSGRFDDKKAASKARF